MEPNRYNIKHARLLALLLVSATFLVDCVVLVMLGPRIVDPDWDALFLFPLMLSQISLVAIWLVLGHATTPWRALGFATTIIFWSVAWATKTGRTGDHLDDVLLLDAILAFAVTLPLAIARILRVRIEFPGDTAASQSDNGLQPGQFSIATMLGWMTVLAITLGTLTWIVPRESWSWDKRPPTAAITLILYITSIASTATWAALGMQPARFRVGALALVVAIGMTIFISATNVPTSDILPVTGILCLPAILMFGSLYVFRIAGYRLRRVTKEGDPIES